MLIGLSRYLEISVLIRAIGYQGLIACDMYNTTKAMIRNLATMVDQHGFVPNGGRVYYLQRSQPPLLSAMVYELYEATNDKAFIAELLPTLMKELNFWNEKRMTSVTIDGKAYQVYQYKTPSNVPRPESYRVDTQNSAKLANGADKQLFYQVRLRILDLLSVITVIFRISQVPLNPAGTSPPVGSRTTNRLPLSRPPKSFQLT